MIEPHVILVDQNDQERGTMPKMEAHIKGELHRAISVFIFDMEGNWIIQQRAKDKYHSANLLSNACCTHPFPGETTQHSANRRLIEEMGLDCELAFAFSFIYKASLDHDLIEHELDHVFVGYTTEIPKPNPDEVSAWRLINYDMLQEDVQHYPERYTEWFKLIYHKVQMFLTINQPHQKN